MVDHHGRDRGLGVGTVFATAGLAFGITALQVLRRFHHLRIYRDRGSCALAALVAVLAAIVAFLVSWKAPGRTAVVGLGAAYPFWAQKPERTGNSTPRPPHWITAVSDHVWWVADVLTDAIEERLNTKQVAVSQEIARQLQEAQAWRTPGEAPLYQSVHRLLVDKANGKKGKKREKLLREAKARDEGAQQLQYGGGFEKLVFMLGLAYEWRYERTIHNALLEPPRPDMIALEDAAQPPISTRRRRRSASGKQAEPKP